MSGVFGIGRVEQASVMVVGCGALGNEVLKCLVMEGFRHIVIVDPDTVEERNLAHSILYGREDVGLPKVEAAARTLRRRCPDLDLRTIHGTIQHHVGLGLIRRMDVVIGCVDNRWARYCINRLCMRAGKMWVDGGIAGLEGTARVFGPGAACYACSLGPEGLAEIGRRISCADVAQAAVEGRHAPTTIVTSSIIAAAQVLEAMKIIENAGRNPRERLPLLAGRMLVCDGEAMSVRIVHFSAYDDDCPHHRPWVPVTDSTLTADSTLREALALIGAEAGEGAAIIASDFSFADFVEHRLTLHTLRVMCPSYMVAPALARLDSAADPAEYLMHGYDRLGADFPYPHLTLRQIGFPDCAVLKVVTGAGDERFISLKPAV